MIKHLMNQKIYTVPEVAKILQISSDRVYNFIETERIKAYKYAGTMWRIAESDLNEFLIEARCYQLKGGQK